MRLEKIKSVILGSAIGDALGVPAEFTPRSELKSKPICDMIGFGTYPYPRGTWSDDTSMSLATLDALAEGYCSADDIMNGFGRWYYNAEYTPANYVFDIGITCADAIDTYFKEGLVNGAPRGERANGNGSLMRIHPLVLYLMSRDGDITADGLNTIYTVSRLTHGHKRAALGCAIFSYVLAELLKSSDLEAVYDGLRRAEEILGGESELSHYRRIFAEDFAALPESDIQSGGYVVESLEAAIWCLLNTDSYESCVLRAVNLGGDTDTTAAIAGALAGALYSYESIPEQWLNTLIKCDYIVDMCKRAHDCWERLNAPISVCDLHSHIVPGVDDGAIDIDMALKMLKTEADAGAKIIFCTSHSTASAEDYSAAYRELRKYAIKSYPEIKLKPGCEVLFYHDIIDEIIHGLHSGSINTLGGTRYVLTEFDPMETEYVINHALKRLSEEGFVPIIAHAERYDAFEDADFAGSMKAAYGAKVQINLYSLVCERDSAIRARARGLLEERLVDFVGTDAHRITHRPPSLTEGIRYIRARCDNSYASDILYKNAEALLLTDK